MIIVKILGGLGNQMYCYSLYRKMCLLGKTAKLDISPYSGTEEKALYELDRIFNVKTVYADQGEITAFRDKTDMVHRVLRKLGIIKRKHIYVDPKNQFIPGLFEYDEVYLDGYWSSFEYFAGIEDQLKSDFSFKLPLDSRNMEMAKIIQDTESVGIHVRRGDYLKLSDIYAILTAEYYNKSIHHIDSMVKNPKYFCFSNDISWCKENIKCADITFIDWNTGDESYKDMQLMSLCKHDIVANSTFSMWAAWLNKNPLKIVTRPKDFFIDKTYNTEHCWPTEWVCIDNN